MRPLLLSLALLTFAACATTGQHVTPSEDQCRMAGCYDGGGDPEFCGTCPVAEEPIAKQERVTIDPQLRASLRPRLHGGHSDKPLDEVIAYNGVPLDFAQSQMAAAGPAMFVDSFSKDCTTTASVINPSGWFMVSYACQAPAAAEAGGTTLIAVGDQDIADPAFATRNSPVYSGDTVREWGGDAKKEYCRADTGTVTIYCRALLLTTTEP